MRGKRFPWKAAGALAVVIIAGCGTVAQAPSSIVTTASNRIATTTAPTTRDNYESDRYCQQLESGAWVTNRLYSTTPCVPDPSRATGDEEVDRSHVIPRCFTCKLSDWTRAEQNKARQASAPSGYTSSSVTAHQPEWSPARRSEVIATCTSSWGGNRTLCDCVVNHAAQQIPASEASSLSPDNARLEVAADECEDAGQKP
jgi:hypothetical protein